MVRDFRAHHGITDKEGEVWSERRVAGEYRTILYPAYVRYQVTIHAIYRTSILQISYSVLRENYCK